jgi:hypothetical protein
MIRTLAAIAALAIAAPAIASAQTTITTTTETTTTVPEIVVHGHGNVYRIVLNTAGKSPRRVRHEIAFAANKACEKVNDDWAGAGASASAIDECVRIARSDAERQYAENRTELYEAGLAPPERIVIPDDDDDY